jgi:hypothetical protein
MMKEQNEKQMDRRTFLKTASRVAGSLAFCSSRLCAVAGQYVPEQRIDDLEIYDFVMPRVSFVPTRQRGQGQGPDTWNVRPGGDANLLNRLSTVIRCRTKPILGTNNWQPQYAAEGQLNAVVTFDSIEKIKKYPFLFMTGENYFQFSNDQKNNLKQYIMRGGFLLMDDCVVGGGGDFFYQSAFKMLEETFGKDTVKRISNDHEVFHNVYDLGDIGLPYLKGQNHGARGIFIGERLAVFLSSNDIHCGWCDSRAKEWNIDKFERAIQMGINIIMYAMSH